MISSTANGALFRYHWNFHQLNIEQCCECILGMDRWPLKYFQDFLSGKRTIATRCLIINSPFVVDYDTKVIDMRNSNAPSNNRAMCFSSGVVPTVPTKRAEILQDDNNEIQFKYAEQSAVSFTSYCRPRVNAMSTVNGQIRANIVSWPGTFSCAQRQYLWASQFAFCEKCPSGGRHRH